MSGSALKKTILFISSLASFLVPYTVSSLNVALPVIGKEFSLDAVTLGWINTAYLLTASVTILPLGSIADIYGRKKIFLLGNILFAIGSGLAVISFSGSWLIAARVVQGLGGAMVFATSVAIVTEVFPPGERGKALGIITATVYGGLSLGPVLGGILTTHFGWPSLFLINIPLALIVIAITLSGVREEWKREESDSFDIRGSIYYGLMLTGCMYGLTLLPSPSGAIWIIGGLAFSVIFIRWEKIQKMPLIRISLFQGNLTFLLSNISAMINYAVVFAVGFLVSLSLQYNRGMDPATCGFILLAQPLIQTIISPIAGHFSDTIEPRIIATAGMATTAIGLVILTLTMTTAPIPVIIGGLAILGLGYGLFSSPNTNAIMSSVEMKDLGIASGMVSTMRSVGQLLSLAIAMMVFSIVIGTVQITPEVYPGLNQSIIYIFVIFVILSFCGIITSYSRGKLRKNAE